MSWESVSCWSEEAEARFARGEKRCWFVDRESGEDRFPSIAAVRVWSTGVSLQKAGREFSRKMEEGEKSRSRILLIFESDVAQPTFSDFVLGATIFVRIHRTSTLRCRARKERRRELEAVHIFLLYFATNESTVRASVVRAAEGRERTENPLRIFISSLFSLRRNSSSPCLTLLRI